MVLNILDPVFAPLLYLDAVWVIIVISVLVSLLSVLVYKFATNQQQMKYLKEEMKKSQAEMRSVRDNPEKMMKVQKKAMEKNMEYMKHSMFASLYTLLPMLFILGWLSAHYAFDPIQPDQAFNLTALTKNPENLTLETSELVKITAPVQSPVNGQATWTLSAPAGKYVLSVHQNEEVSQHTVIIGEKSAIPLVNSKGNITRTTIAYTPLKMKILGVTFTWFWAYFLFTLIFSMLFRKVFNVY